MFVRTANHSNRIHSMRKAEKIRNVQNHFFIQMKYDGTMHDSRSSMNKINLTGCSMGIPANANYYQVKSVLNRHVDSVDWNFHKLREEGKEKKNEKERKEQANELNMLNQEDQKKVNLAFNQFERTLREIPKNRRKNLHFHFIFVLI